MMRKPGLWQRGMSLAVMGVCISILLAGCDMSQVSGMLDQIGSMAGDLTSRFLGPDIGDMVTKGFSMAQKILPQIDGMLKSKNPMGAFLGGVEKGP